MLKASEEMADRLKIDAAAGRHVGDGDVGVPFSPFLPLLNTDTILNTPEG